MMDADKVKYKNMAFTLMPGMKMYTTLSDRLKQAGIKESKPKSQGKKDKNTKRRKSLCKKKYAICYTTNSSQRSKKLRKPLTHSISPHLENNHVGDDVREEIISKEPVGQSQDSPESGEDTSEKVTIFVSLDFIEDCQNYKKKVRKPKHDWPKAQRRNVTRTSSNPKQHPDKRGASQKPQEVDRYNDTRSLHYVDREERRPEIRRTNEVSLGESYSNVNAKQGGKAGKETAEGVQSAQPSPNNPRADDIAKIDKKYLESILSFTMRKDRKKNMEEVSEDETEETKSDSQTEKRKKLPGKVFFERKIKTKEIQREYFQKEDIQIAENRRNNSQKSTRNDARIVRELTKSEEQMKLKRDKNFYNQNNNDFKIKSKNETYSKPDFKGVTRRKRKPGNKFKKNSVEEFIETSLPREMSEVTDVKELWKRENQEKSENSLTSHSSFSIPETDEIRWNKDLESYKTLNKLVESEISNIAKGSNYEDNTGGAKKKENKNLASSREPEDAKKEFPSSDNSSGVKKNIRILKKRLLQAEYNSGYEEKMQKSQLLNFLGEDIPQEARPKLMRLEKEKEGEKVPSQVIENWSILNRLEQAFMALGTPTFPSKNIRKSNSLKDKFSTGNGQSKGSSKKRSPDGVKESKKNQKSKDPYPKRDCKSSGSPIPSYKRSRVGNSAKAIEIVASGTEINVSKGRHQAYKLRNESKQEPTTETVAKNSKHDENNSKQKKRKIRTPTEKSLSKKSGTRLHVTSKAQDPCKKKSSNTVDLHKKKNSENLERKKTFNVLPDIDTSAIQPRKSKSYDLNDSNLDTRYPQTKNQIPKNHDAFPSGLKEERKLRSRSSGNDAATKATSVFPKGRERNPMKEKLLEVFQNPKTLDEGGCQKENCGALINLPEVNHEKGTEKTKRKPLSGCTRQGRDINNSKGNTRDNDTDKTTIFINDSRKNTTTIIIDDNNTKTKVDNLTHRMVKKRSSISTLANHHCDQSHRKLIQINEKVNLDDSQKKMNRELSNFQKELKKIYSNTSIIGTYQLVDHNVQNHFTRDADTPKISQRSTVSSITNSVQHDPNVEEAEDNCKTLRKRPLWEQDISHYHTIVREIMNQYKRTDGLLKQNDGWNYFSKDSNSSEAVDGSDKLSECDGSRRFNIHEYRKKIISEYKELPIFEYKRQQNKSKDESFPLEGSRKKNLSVVKDFNTSADVDVKDYQPNIQRVLDSQLYVDAESLVKRNEHKIKFKEKKSSLQEFIVGKAEKVVSSDGWPRSCSTPEDSFSPFQC